MKKIRPLLLIPISLAVAGLACAADSAPPPLLLDLSAVSAASLAPRVRAALATPLVTIVDKPVPSPTGDAHDYVSYARYWWPNPATADGLPYVRHDGHSNEKQVHLGDEPRLFKFTGTTETLALGWAVLHREDCARRAGDWLRAWFITPATRMNPGFGYAQIRLGHDHNRGNHSGVLDARSLTQVADALRLLHGSPALTAAEESAVHAWFKSYLHWLLTSENGRGEHEARNNHGSWYLVQAVALARFVGDDALARRLCEEDRARIGWQIEPDGRQPLELARVDGLGYSIFNLQAQFQLAHLATGLGLDLWHYQAADGASLKKALDYLAPYNAAPQTWPHHQLRKLAPGFLDGLLHQAAAVWPDAGHAK